MGERESVILSLIHSPFLPPPSYQTWQDGRMWRSDVVFHRIQPSDRGAYTCTILGSTPSVTLTVLLFVESGETVCLFPCFTHSLVDLIFSHIWGQVWVSLSESHTNMHAYACLLGPTTYMYYKFHTSSDIPSDPPSRVGPVFSTTDLLTR